jgi:hypothetical protein
MLQQKSRVDRNIRVRGGARFAVASGCHPRMQENVQELIGRQAQCKCAGGRFGQSEQRKLLAVTLPAATTSLPELTRMSAEAVDSNASEPVAVAPSEYCIKSGTLAADGPSTVAESTNTAFAVDSNDEPLAEASGMPGPPVADPIMPLKVKLPSPALKLL